MLVISTPLHHPKEGDQVMASITLFVVKTRDEESREVKCLYKKETLHKDAVSTTIGESI